MADAANLPWGHSPFTRLSPEIQAMIWTYVAETAADFFKQHNPHYERVWLVEARGPYVRYRSRDLTAHEANTVQTFLTLLQVNRRSRHVTRRYVDMVYERRMPDRLALKFIDKFLVENETFTILINASAVSNDALRTMAGLTATYTYPGVLEQTRQRHLSFLSTLTNVVVPSTVFMQTQPSLVCRELLLCLPNLKNVYVLHQTSPNPVTSLLYIQFPLGSFNGFLELGEIHDGHFRLGLDRQDLFKREYSQRLSELNGGDPSRYSIGCNAAWTSHEQWMQLHMNAFLTFLGPFVTKGVNCVVVANCY
ncbi:hypothetical protein F4818DRAFT_291163 [Hypoxylon cercidicola]|nr:hypothetical protein F4818DRAFT_291163 [Hypoxylon cercidicola]